MGRRWAGALLGALLVAGCGGGGQSASAPPTPSAPPASGGPVSSGAPATSSSSPSIDGQALESDVYGYTTAVPNGLLLSPAARPWDGGDVDHTEDYADRATDAETIDLFVLAAPTDLILSDAVDQHLSWLTTERGCPAPSSRQDTALDGQPAIEAVIHCPEGVFGPTKVTKLMVVHDGRFVIATSFTPDDGTDEVPGAMKTVRASWRWTR